MQSAWTVLNEDEGWGTAQVWHDPATDPAQNASEAAAFALQLVNGRRRRRVGPTNPFSSSFRPKQLRKKLRNRCWVLIFALIVTLGVVAVTFTTIKHHTSYTFDPQAGPRGQLPAPPPGPPLPVLNLLDSGNHSTTGPASVYFGASIDWSKEDPQSFNRGLGRNAAIIDGYYMISQGLERVITVNSSGVAHAIPDYYNWTAALVGGTGAILGMTVMPYKGLDNISLDAMLQLGSKCAEINKAGVPVLLRFAPEMNGNWYPWGQSPSQYKNVFRQLATIVRNATALPTSSFANSTIDNLTNTTTSDTSKYARTAIVWAPAAGAGYPYLNVNNSSLASLPYNATRWSEMDTNGDSRVDELDDPYNPYYPGNAYVDWIGITALYNTTLGRNATVATAMADVVDSSIVPAVANSSATLSASTRHPTTTTTRFFAAVPTATVVVDLNYNAIPPSSRANASSFESMVDGKLWSLYSFAKGRKVPIIVGETGVGYLEGPGVTATPSELEVKEGWWNQVFNATILKKYPLIRAVVWYDYALPVVMAPSFTLDYSLSHSPSIASAFMQTVGALPNGTLVFANETNLPMSDRATHLSVGAANATTSASSTRTSPVTETRT
ncbi:hypothetical protein HKX48_008110 [Thoreauomyces humboldtii]|nr:hypothetical protein HKX48_008110 [Thoreauomyces humboldtii]